MTRFSRSFVTLLLFTTLFTGLSGSSYVGGIFTTVAKAQGDEVPVRRCSVGTLKGRYGVSATGLIAGFGPVAFVGWADFDGVGSVNGADWASFNGAISTRTTTGSYTVKDDCTGTVTFVSETRNIEVHFQLVLVEGGKEVLFIETDPGTVVTGVLRQL